MYNRISNTCSSTFIIIFFPFTHTRGAQIEQKRLAKGKPPTRGSDPKACLKTLKQDVKNLCRFFLEKTLFIKFHMICICTCTHAVERFSVLRMSHMCKCLALFVVLSGLCYRRRMLLSLDPYCYARVRPACYLSRRVIPRTRSLLLGSHERARLRSPPERHPEGSLNS